MVGWVWVGGRSRTESVKENAGGGGAPSSWFSRTRRCMCCLGASLDHSSRPRLALTSATTTATHTQLPRHTLQSASLVLGPLPWITAPLISSKPLLTKLPPLPPHHSCNHAGVPLHVGAARPGGHHTSLFRAPGHEHRELPLHRRVQQVSVFYGEGKGKLLLNIIKYPPHPCLPTQFLSPVDAWP